MQEKLYSLILNNLDQSDSGLQKVPVSDITSKMGKQLSDSELLEIICELVNTRIGIQEDKGVKKIPVFRHIQLTKNDLEDMELEVIFDKKAINFFKSE